MSKEVKNLCESDNDAARRFAKEVIRLQSENSALRTENERLQFKYDEIRKWADEQIAAAEERGWNAAREPDPKEDNYHWGWSTIKKWRESRKGE